MQYIVKTKLSCKLKRNIRRSKAYWEWLIVGKVVLTHWKGTLYYEESLFIVLISRVQALYYNDTISISFLSVIPLIEKYTIIKFIFVSYNLIGLWSFRCLKRFYVTNYMVGKSDSSALSLLLEKASKNNSYKRINSLNVHTHNIALHKSIYKYEVS